MIALTDRYVPMDWGELHKCDVSPISFNTLLISQCKVSIREKDELSFANSITKLISQHTLNTRDIIESFMSSTGMDDNNATIFAKTHADTYVMERWRHWRTICDECS